MRNYFSKLGTQVPWRTSQSRGATLALPLRYLSALLILLTLSIGQSWADTKTYNFDDGVALATDWNVETTVPSGGTAECLITNSLSGAGFSEKDGNYLGLAYKNKSGITITVTTTASYENISNVTFKAVAGDNSKPSFAAYIVTTDGDVEVFAAIGSKDGFATGGTNKWGSKSVDLATTKTGKLKIVTYASSSGKYAAIDDVVITYTPSGGGGGGDPIDPTFTYTTATYTIGDPALDLSTKLSSNSSGAITFAVSSSDAGTTGASIASNKNFTATTAGTATITVSQVAATGYNAKTQDITVNVVEPDPCTTYFHFVATADATANGKTNWDGFTNAVTGSSGQTNSVTIDGTTYNLTKRTGSTGGGGTILGFTIPANKAGTLYGYMKSSGSAARTLSLKKGDDVVKTNTEIVDGNWTLITISAIAPGTYTLSPDQNVQIQMFALKVCDATFHTITLDLDGGTGATSISALDGVPASKPADPTKDHCRFAGWYNGASPYDWTANVTGYLTLTAHWTQLYTVTYAAGDGSATGSAPTQEDLAAGETFSVAANPFTVDGKDFVTWNDGSADYAPSVTYTMGSANVTLTAQWTAASAKYTVHYMDADGTTPLGADELVNVGNHPVGITATKPLNTFVAWQLSGSDIALDDASWASVAANAEVTLTARWAKAYATDIDFEAFIDANGTSGDWGAELTAKNYAISSTTNVTLDNQGASKPADKGLKIKNNAGAYLSFNVNAGKLVLVKTGRVNGLEASGDGGANYADLSGAGSSEGASVVNPLYNAAEAEYRIRTKVDGYNIIQAITITDPFTVSFDANGGDEVASLNGTPSVKLPNATKGTESFLGWFTEATGGEKIGEAGESYTPTADITLHAQWEAVSTDARLNAITFSSDAGTLSPAFDPEVTSYTYTMPYGTAAVPTITSATKANPAAKDPVIDAQAAAWGETAHVHGVAASDDTKDYYVQMLRAPKDGVCIIKATINSTTKNTIGEVTGLYKKDASCGGLSSYKFNGKGAYIGLELVSGQTFNEGDIINVHTTTAAGQGTIALFDDHGNTVSAFHDYGVMGGAGDNKFALPASAEEKSLIYVCRTEANTWNGYVDFIEVTRAMNPLLETLSINGKDADVSSTDITMELATSTNLNSLAIVETYISNDNSQVTTAVISNSGNWVEGENTYRVTDKDGDYTDYTITISLVTPAVAPTIETDLAASGTYEEYSSAALSIVASSSDGGTLSYQWYKDDVAIEGAVEASYNVSEEGTYKVIVKNSLSATNYATATSTACVMTVVMPSGCDELASIPSAEPFQYVQTGEWTLYSITSGGKLNTTNKFKNNAKNFAGDNVNAISDQRFAMKFDKNVEHVDFYATASSTRTWNGSKAIQVTEDDIAGSTVAYTDVTAKFTTDLTTIVPSGTRQYIFRATGIFEAGKTYWFTFNGGLDVFRICYAEALEKPVLPTLSDEDICEGGSFSEMSVASASVSEGTLSYQWYKDDEVIEGSEAATYQPTSAGTYYVVVTNSLLGRQPISAESNHAVLTASTSAVITTAPKDVRDDADKSATLTVVAVGKNLHYAWKECATIDGTYTDVTGAADAASLEVTVPEGVKYYKVVVSSDCGGDVEAIAKVEKWVELSQVNVTATTEWDWVNAGENNKLSAGKNVEILMANIRENDVIPTNDATFNSQALLFYGENVRNVESGRAYASVGHISFNTTVPGAVFVEFSDNGSNNRRLSINGKLSDPSATKTDVKTFMATVPAGEVVLMGVDEDGTGENKYLRISKISFVKTDYTREVNSGRYGTICLPNGGKMYGAALYEVAYLDASAKKIYFDEVLNGEMVAGTPYIFLPNAGIDLLAVAYTDEANAPAGDMNGLYGSYTQQLLAKDAGNYILLNNQYLEVNSDEVYVGANRAYLKIGVSGGVPTTAIAPVPGRRRIAMGVTSEKVATGIDNLNANEQPMKVIIDGQLFILRGEQMFDATGRLVK